MKECGSNFKMILQGFFLTFSRNAKKSEIEERIEFPKLLVEQNLISEEDFYEVFEETCVLIYLEHSDLPFFDQFFGRFIIDLIKEKFIDVDKLPILTKRSKILDEDE